MAKPRAFRCKVSGFEAGIYLAESAGKARYRTYASAGDAGYDLDFADIRVRRSPEYDALELPKHGLVESAAKSELNRLTRESEDT